MGIEVIVAAATLTSSIVSANEQKKQAKKAAAAQQQNRNEENARNKAQQMAERRAQIREERVKRARVLQSAQNTGVAFSSGETGATSSLSTNLNSNIGFNQSMIASGERMSVFSQNAADAQMRGQNAAMLGNLALNLAPFAAEVGGSIFKPTQPTGQSTNQPSVESYYGVR